MPLRIINDSELMRLVRAGQSPKEIADKMGVGVSAVCKRLKRLKIGMVRDVALRSASKIVGEGIKGLRQLEKINAAINLELDRIEEDANGLTGAERERFQEQRLKHVAEIRRQLGLYLDFYQVHIHGEEVIKFQQLLVDTVKEIAPEAWAIFIKRLREIHAIRSDLDMGMM